jgi:uncharacterized membrane protein YphA (DoxX/SURF4 family)
MTRHYPGFFAAFFIILLRVAIGWHFLTEGSEKYESIGRGKEAFSAEVYLRNANGPLAPYFRELLPDVDGREALDESKLKESWRSDINRIARHFGSTEAQRSEASKLLDEAERWADRWFSDPENREKSKKYLHQLDEVEATEKNPQAMSFELERAREARRGLDTERRALVGALEERSKAFRDAVVAKLATSEQVRDAKAPLLSRVGPQAPAASDSDAIKAAEAARPWDQLDWINFATTYGLIAIGICLILGFLTPLAALGAAAFLAMIYLSMPPWPGLPTNPRAEGHYFIVSKNLIELIACLVIATTPSGHWIGLDALFFGARRRRRLAPATPDRTPASTPGRMPAADRPVPTKGDPDREPIPIG